VCHRSATTEAGLLFSFNADGWTVTSCITFTLVNRNRAGIAFRLNFKAIFTRFLHRERHVRCIDLVDFTVIEMAIVASIWYLAMTSILTVGQYYIERYYARGAQRELPMTPFQRFRQLLVTFHAPPPDVPLSVPVGRR